MNGSAITAGCFDLFHRGHYEMIRSSLLICPNLTVVVMTDEYVRNRKGDGRPAQLLHERIRTIKSIFPEVDIQVCSLDDEIKRLATAYDLFIQGEDQENLRMNHPGEIYLARTAGVSTTDLLGSA